VSPEEIRKALMATNIPADQLIMPWSGVRFDDKGQNTGVRAILQQVQKGAYATIFPFDLAAADVVYPVVSWKDRK
jgi:branched-chain amino acid transport system substrate-binding protein